MSDTVVGKIIEHLELIPLPVEGGYYKVTYESDDKLKSHNLPARYTSDRALSNAIYYVIHSNNFSAMHKLNSDEIWHFYAGDPVELSLIYQHGKSETVLLGSDILGGENPQFFVPHGTWEGARLVDGGEYALLGTTIAPGYDEADFVIGKRMDLLQQFPSLEKLIKRLTRE